MVLRKLCPYGKLYPMERNLHYCLALFAKIYSRMTIDLSIKVYTIKRLGGSGGCFCGMRVGKGSYHITESNTINKIHL